MKYELSETINADVRLPDHGHVHLALPQGIHDVSAAEAAAIEALLVPRGLAALVPDSPPDLPPAAPAAPRSRKE